MAGEKILIVDDDEIIRTLLHDLLEEDEGYVCEVAASGEEGLTEIKNQDFDLVMLDIKLPGKDGIEILRTVRKMNPDLNVIMMTGHPNIKTEKESIRLGAFKYITKPIDFEKVLPMIRAALEKHREALEQAR